MNNNAESKVIFREKTCSFDDKIRALTIMAFHVRQGITKNAKYIKDNMYGVIAKNREKIMYDLLLLGICQYLASSDIPREKPRKPKKLFIIGYIWELLNSFMKTNWVKRPSNKPAFRCNPDFRYFQSWSPNKKWVPWYKKIIFSSMNVIISEKKNGVLAFFISDDM